MNHFGMRSSQVCTDFIVQKVRETADQLGRRVRMAEVGTWVGASAAQFADAGADVVCIDTFVGSTDKRDALANKDTNPAEVFAVWRENVGGRLGRSVVLLHSDTGEAAKYFPDGWFDLAYIDACHNYDECRRDIVTWEPKVRPGGLILCHDYRWFAGVTRAVDELRAGRFQTGGHAVAWWEVER